MTSPTFNLFRVLGLNYEVFHTRMLHWLWTPNADHGAGARFLTPFLSAIGVDVASDLALDIECEIDVPGRPCLRIADILVRTPKHLILVENKVDRYYQDVAQLRDEIAGGRALAEGEGRKFILVLIAPGPISPAVEEVLHTNGVFVSWQKAVELITSANTDDLDRFVQTVIQQYADFMLRPAAGIQADPILADCESGVRQLIEELAPSTATSAEELWAVFTQRYPDHVNALTERYADKSNYSAKSWFSAKLQRMAANREGLEDTGDWRKAGASWGYPKVRVYRRVGA